LYREWFRHHVEAKVFIVFEKLREICSPGSLFDRTRWNRSLTSISVKSVLARLWPFLRPVAWSAACGLAATALVAATETSIPAFLKVVLAYGFGEHAPQSAWWTIPLAFLGLACLRGGAQFASAYLLGYVSNNVVIRIRQAMIERVVRAGAPLPHRH
jgi:subfamily B ATP-binding cassette protein MsbA